ncbi:MAG: PIG-L family deacetylase [Candidatus Omnitrophota bacterium]|nr:PIG-L family deacetylase [Candidatus Omnitrophota bacterium]
MTLKVIRFFFLLSCIAFFHCRYALAEIDFSPKDRVLILAPHPDDEVLALAGVIQRARAKGAQIKIAYLTNGDYNELSYFLYKKKPALSKGGFIQIGKTRQQEAYKAMEFLGVGKDSLIFLGYPDRFTESILTSFWNKDKPPASFITRIDRVPYEDAPSFGAAYVGQSILADLKNILLKFKPTQIFVSSPQDTNPDHRSLYIYLKVALLDLIGQLEPAVNPYLVHKAGWPKPRKYLPSFVLELPNDVDNRGIIWEKFPLTDQEIKNKYQAVSFYKSQLTFAKQYFLSFIRKNELFCFYQGIDLSKGKFMRSFNVDSEFVSQITYSKDKDFLCIRIAFNKKVAKGIKADIYLLGYRSDLDFSFMPKVFLKAKGKYIITYEKRKRFIMDGVEATADETNMFIRLPLKALSDPEYIFSRIVLKGKVFALHIAPWAILKM